MKILMILFLMTAGTVLSPGQQQTDCYKVAVFIYQGVELLDFAGPLEVFSNTKQFDVFTIAPRLETITAMNKNIKLIPNYSVRDCPHPDIIVFPGAAMEGLMPVYNDTTIINWIARMHKEAKYTMSVCTGAAFLSKAGVLDHRTVTTHWGAIQNLRALTPTATVVADKRFVQDGPLLTTAGVSAGLDGALHLVATVHGREEALRVARLIEYDKWNPDSGAVIESSNEKTNLKK